MLSFLIAIAAGLVCGVLSGFGIGGGSLLMVWMTAVLSMEQKAAQGINLLYFLPTAAAALIFHSTRTTVPIEMNSPKAGALFWNRVYSTAPITASPSIVRALIAQRGT